MYVCMYYYLVFVLCNNFAPSCGPRAVVLRKWQIVLDDTKRCYFRPERAKSMLMRKVAHIGRRQKNHVKLSYRIVS